MCILCDNMSYEDTRHMVMQCQFHHDTRERMLGMIDEISDIDAADVFSVLLGKHIDGWSFRDMLPVWHISCTYISNMYRAVLQFHKRYN